MDIFTLHMIFGFLFGALIVACLGVMPVAGGLAFVLVIYFAVFLFGGSGGSGGSGGWKRVRISANSDEARAGERAFGIPASQRSADVQKLGAFERFCYWVFAVRCGRRRITARKLMPRPHKQVMLM